MLRQYLFFSLIALMFSSCNRFEPCLIEFDYECLPEPPQTAEVSIGISPNAENPRVPIEIFEGDYDDPNRNWIVRDTVSTNYAFYRVPVNAEENSERQWLVAATYELEDRRVVVFDDATVSWSRDESCASECHIALGGWALVRLERD